MMNYISRILLLLSLILLYVNCFSQRLFNNTVGDEYDYFSKPINYFIQDDNGFMWIGSNLNLGKKSSTFKYDGSRVIDFLEISKIRPIFLGKSHKKDCLWLCSWNDIYLYNTVSNSIEVKQRIKNVSILTATIDKDDILWVGTTGGIGSFNREKDEFTWLQPKRNQLSHGRIKSLYVTPDKKYLWVGTYNKLNKIDLSDPDLSVNTYDLKEEYDKNIPNNLISVIIPFAKDQTDKLWIGTQTGLCLFNSKTGNYIPFRVDNSILKSNLIQTLADDGKYIWIGTSMGLYKMNKETYVMEAFFHQALLPSTLINNNILTTFIDDSGVLWIGTRNGFSRTETHDLPFKTIVINEISDKYITGNRIASITCNKDTTFWLATNGGIIRYKNGEILPPLETIYPSSKLLSNNVLDIINNNNKIYITTSSGINIWDTQLKKMTSLATGVLTNNQLRYPVNILSTDKNKLVIQNHENNIFIYEQTKNGIYHFKLLTSFNSHRLIAINSGIWALMPNQLIFYSYKKDSVTIKKEFRKNITTQILRRFTALNDSILWIGTNNELIEYRVSSNSVTTFKYDNRDENELANIISDLDGNIWASTAHTVIKLNSETGKFDYFPLKKSSPVNRMIFNCACVTPDGQVAFGGYDGFIIFNNDTVKEIHYKAPIKITLLKIKNIPVVAHQKFEGSIIIKKDISTIDEIELKHSQNSITIGFSSLHYAASEQSKFLYKLEGFDNEWVSTSGRNNQINYSNLRPGKYIFKVNGTNNYGDWSAKSDILKITIKPHPMLSLPAIFFYCIFFMLLIYTFILLRIKIVESKNEIKIVNLKVKYNEELIETKQKFFTNISHELRTPLSLIVGPMLKIFNHPDLPDNLKRQTAIAYRNIQRLQRLVNQILDFRKLESDGIRLRISKINDITPYIKNIFELYSSYAQNNNILYSFHTYKSTIECWVDIQRIETAVSNLLSNAFKFTPINGTIELKVSKVNANEEFNHGALLIEVSDTGTGIPEEELSKVFERFYQSQGKRGKLQGSGIGLSMVKEYIEKHGGKISLKSKLNKGTTVSLYIPLGNKHLYSEDFISTEETASVFNKTDVIIQPDSKKIIPNDKKLPTVLIVEDEPELIEFIQLNLQSNYNFISAPNGKVGLEVIKNSDVNIVVSDVSMPVMDGYEMCEKIKQNTPDLPVILLTAKTLIEDEIKGINCGANIYLSKPFDIGLLNAYIESLLKVSGKNTIPLTDIITPSKIVIESVEEKILQRFVAYVENHMSDTELANDHLCAELGFSYSTLYRKIKAATDMSIAELVRSIKLKRAAQLLADGNMNVTEVMYAVGFTSNSYFSRCFKNEYKVTPSSFSKEDLNNNI